MNQLPEVDGDALRPHIEHVSVTRSRKKTHLHLPTRDEEDCTVTRCRLKERYATPYPNLTVRTVKKSVYPPGYVDWCQRCVTDLAEEVGIL